MGKSEDELLDKVLGEDEDREPVGQDLSDEESKLLDKILDDGNKQPGKKEKASRSDGSKKPSAVSKKPEERKKKPVLKAVLFSAAIFVMLALTVVLIFTLGGIELIKSTHAMTVNGVKVDAEDLKLFMMLTGYTEDRDSAAQTLTQYKVVLMEAKNRGMTLTDSEISEIAGQVDEMKSYIDSLGYAFPNVPDERVKEYLSVPVLFEKLVDEFAAFLVFDETDFQDQYLMYKENYKAYYIETELKYVITTFAEEAYEAYDLLKAGEEVDKVIEEYSEEYEYEGIATIMLSEVPIEQYEAEAIIELGVGGVSEVIDMEDFYAIFIVQSIRVPEEDELLETFRGLYDDNNAYTAANEEVARWTDAAKVEINQKVYDTVVVA